MRQGNWACSHRKPKLKCKLEALKEGSILSQRLQESPKRTTEALGLRASKQRGCTKHGLSVCGCTCHIQCAGSVWTLLLHSACAVCVDMPSRSSGGSLSSQDGQPALPSPTCAPTETPPATLPYPCVPDWLLCRPPHHLLWPQGLPPRHPTPASPTRASAACSGSKPSGTLLSCHSTQTAQPGAQGAPPTGLHPSHLAPKAWSETPPPGSLPWFPHPPGSLPLGLPHRTSLEMSQGLCPCFQSVSSKIMRALQAGHPVPTASPNTPASLAAGGLRHICSPD